MFLYRYAFIYLLLIFLSSCSGLGLEEKIDGDESEDDEIVEIGCSTDYRPVCALVQVQCITTPCPPLWQTVTDDCTLERMDVVEYREGGCEEGDTPPEEGDSKIADEGKQTIADEDQPAIADGDEIATNEEEMEGIKGINEGMGEVQALPPERSLKSLQTMMLKGDAFVLGDVLSETETYTRYTITYESNGLTISGIMNIPHGDGPFPLVIFNHGYIDPAIYTNGRGLKREQDYLARQGFAVLHPDYRGHAFSDPSPDESHVYDATVEYSMDVINAISAIRSADLPSVDASRIGMLGHSMGGGVTMNIATMFPDLIDAIVLYAPVHTDAWENYARWRSERIGDRTTEVLGTRETHPEQWDLLSSASYLESVDDPVLLFHGTADKDVPLFWSQDLSKTLEDLGRSIEYVEYEGEGHEYSFQWQDFMERTAAFYDRVLRSS